MTTAPTTVPDSPPTPDSPDDYRQSALLASLAIVGGVDPRPRLGGPVSVTTAAGSETAGVVVRLGVQKLFVRLTSGASVGAGASGVGGELRRLAVSAVFACQAIPATIERFPTSDEFVQLWANLLVFAMDAPRSAAADQDKSPAQGEYIGSGEVLGNQLTLMICLE